MTPFRHRVLEVVQKQCGSPFNICDVLGMDCTGLIIHNVVAALEWLEAHGYIANESITAKGEKYLAERSVPCPC